MRKEDMLPHIQRIAFQIARKALEPPDMLEEDAGEQGIAPAVPAVPWARRSTGVQCAAGA